MSVAAQRCQSGSILLYYGGEICRTALHGLGDDNARLRKQNAALLAACIESMKLIHHVHNAYEGGCTIKKVVEIDYHILDEHPESLKTLHSKVRDAIALVEGKP